MEGEEAASLDSRAGIARTASDQTISVTCPASFSNNATCCLRLGRSQRISPAHLTFQEDPQSSSDDILFFSLDASGNLEYDISGSADGEGPLDPPGTFHISDLGPVEGMDFSASDVAMDADVLELIAYDVATLEIAHSGTSNSGTIRLDGGSDIAFASIEELIQDGNAKQLTVDVTQVGMPVPDLVVENDAQAGFSTICASTFATTRFANPTRRQPRSRDLSSRRAMDPQPPSSR
jgi:hypothetical protein